MKRVSVIALAAALSIGVGSASAADIYGGASTKDVDYTPDRVNWTGLYVGGAIGYGNANHDLSVRDFFKDYCGDAEKLALPDFDIFDNNDRPDRFEDLGDDEVLSCVEEPHDGDDGTLVSGDSREVANFDGLNTTGVVGDLRLGYDQQVGRFVLGVFGSYGFSDMEGSDTNLGGGIRDFNMERGDDWSIGARAGALVNDRTLLYILAAYTETEYTASGTLGGDRLVPFSEDTTFSGITVGGGVEFALTNNIFLGVEGTHTFYDEEELLNSFNAERNVGVAINDNLGETKVMGTVKIKLGQDLFQ